MSDDCEMSLLVQADVDGELDPGQAASVAAHRETCATCQATYARLRRTRASLRNGLTYHEASPALRRAISARLAEVAAPETAPTPARALPQMSPWWWRMAASFGMGAAIAASLMLVMLPKPGEQSLADQVVASHIRALQPGNEDGVVSTDRHTVKPWFDGKLDYAPPVKDLTTEGFPLLGGRLDYIGGRPVAALDYRRAKHPIHLFLWPAAGAGDTAPSISDHAGYNIIHWRKDGSDLWAVSDVEKRELQDFVKLWNEAS